MLEGIVRCLHLNVQESFGMSTGSSSRLFTEVLGHCRIVSSHIIVVPRHPMTKRRCHRDITIIVALQFTKIHTDESHNLEGTTGVNLP